VNPFFPPAPDLTFFLQGFTFLLMAVFLHWSRPRFPLTGQGGCFVAFLVASAVHAWLHMITLGFPAGDVYVTLLSLTQAGAFACLAMAGYRAFVPADKVSPVLRWLPLAPFLLFAVALPLGLRPFFLACHLGAGALALTLGGAGLMRAFVPAGGNPLLWRTALGVLLLAVASNALAPYPILPGAWGVSLHGRLEGAHLIPELLELAGLALAMALMHLDARRARLADDRHRLLAGPIRGHFRVAVAAMVVIIGFGWFFMGRAQQRQDTVERDRILQAIRNGALAFSAREIQLLSGTLEDLNHLSYQRIKGQLQDMRRANPGSRFLYLMGLRDGRVFFFADSEPADTPDASPPGQVYDQATDVLLGVFASGQEATEGPVPDAWGIWVSGLVPISNGSGVVAVLGMDIDARDWRRVLFRSRLAALSVMWLGCLLILGVFLYMRKTGENAQVLAESEHKYRALFEESADAYFLLGDVFVDCNSAACQLLGLPKEGILGKTPWDFSPERQPDGRPSREAARARIDAALRGETQAFSWDHRTAGGALLHTDVRLSRVRMGDEPLVQVIVRDRTEELARREHERLMEARLSESQRWEGLANLAGGVAHDFNNLITSIAGNVHLIQLEGRQPPRVGESLDAILESARLATELARQMLAYAGKSTLSVRPFRLGQVVENMEKVLRAAAGARARVELEVAPELPAVLGDPTQFQQIVLNLVVNAAEAIERRDGLIRVSVHHTTFTAEQMAGCVFREQPPAGEYVVLTVRDNGAGIPADVLPRVFEPFFTTKFTGRGLGLAAVAGIVHNHGGAISLHSVPRTGTVVEVRLPATHRAPEAKSFISNQELPALQPLRILLVEDEDCLQVLARRILERHGHTVLTAVDGEEGLRLAREHAGAIDLVFADVLMPRMTGLELAALLRQEFPDLPILLTSGHVPEQGEREFRLADGFLPKPYHYKDLFRKIHEALAKH